MHCRAWAQSARPTQPPVLWRQGIPKA